MKTQQTQHTSGLWQDLKDLPGRYWVLFSGTLVNRFGHFVVPFLALYLRQAGHGTWVTGIVLAAYGAGALGAGAIGGYLADRVDPNLVWVGMFGIGVVAAAAILPSGAAAPGIDDGREAFALAPLTLSPLRSGSEASGGGDVAMTSAESVESEQRARGST